MIDPRDDNEALAVAVSVNHLNPDAHVVVTLRDISRADHFTYVSDRMRCVQWHIPRMATEELQDPGLTQVYSELMTAAGGGDTFSVSLPESARPTTFGECQLALGRVHQATVLAVRPNGRLLISPGWDTELPGGTMLYYVGHGRLRPPDVAAALQDVGGSVGT